MKLKKIYPLLVALAGFAFVHSAAAEVCTADTFLGSQDLGNSGDATELAAMEAFAGQTLTLDYKLNNNEAGFNIQACSTVADTFYIDVAPDTPGFFLLKFGTGSFPAGTDDTYFFANGAELSELVFTSAQVSCLIGGTGCQQQGGLARLSHYAIYNGDHQNQTPEPGTLALLGIGALAFGFARRRRGRG